MSFFDLLLIFFLLSSLWPVVRQRMLDAARYRLLQQLERKRGTRVIAMIHRQETISFLGIPIARYIDIQDSEEVLRAIKLTDDGVPIDLVLHTPGGLVLATEQIAHALRKHPSKVTVMVPHYAMSGGTLLAMVADEVLMDDNAVLGPVDPQVGQWPAASVLNVLESKNRNEIDDETLIMADIARKAIWQVKQTVKEIVSERMTPEQAERFAETMATGTWTHDYPISAEEAQALGFPIKTELPKEVYDLMNLYPQPGQRRPSVQYIPSPYPAPGDTSKERRRAQF